MTYVYNLKTYEGVLVSSVAHDFRGHRHEDIPQALVVEWVDLLTKLTRVIHPQFNPLSVPGILSFQTESIDSDGPYPSSENFYTLEYVSLTQLNSYGVGWTLSFENFRQGGSNPIEIETRGLYPKTSSYINEDAWEPRACVYVFHNDDKTSEIEAIIAQHTAECFAKRRR